jgi:hypothetical protein
MQGNLPTLDCANAETASTNEKKSIQELLDREIGIENANRIVRRAILQTFAEQYGGKRGDLRVPSLGLLATIRCR